MTDRSADLTTPAATAQHARELFASSGYYCAQSVLLAIAEHQGVDTALLPAISTGFCSGLARTNGVCGAVTGAIMGLGLVNGMHTPTDDRAANYQAVSTLLETFEAQFGSTNCFTLTDCDLATPEGQTKFRADGVGEKCLDYVEQATRLALEAAEGV
ncbi:MAG: C-GCAxxG-C-C family protein [Anaerolineae bacterium]|nr:C-GCAxxG-C-C family protein [Anaerolineae bacterium]